MSFILLIILSMIVANVALLAGLMVVARRSRLKWFVLAFIGGQVAGLLWLLGERSFDFSWELPNFAIRTLYIWHFLGLAIFLPVVGLVLGVLLARKIRDRFGLSGKRTASSGGAAEEEQGITRRRFLGTALALAPPLFTVGVSGVALRQLEQFRVRRVNLVLPSLPRDLDGLTIAHLSDMHVGPFTTGRVLRKMARVTNDLRTDLVLLTGDLINSDLADLPEAIDTLMAMEGRFGVWTIEGNHDHIENGREFRRRMRASGLNFLMDEQAILSVRGYPVQLLGLPWIHGRGEDYDSLLHDHSRRLLEKRQAGAFPIFLAHHPHAFDVAAEVGIPLTLTGHTHGGQLMLNEEMGFGPAIFRYWSGVYNSGDSRLVVSNGTGNWFPIRINAPAEIIHLTLRSG